MKIRTTSHLLGKREVSKGQKDILVNLVLRVLSYPPYEARERKTLVTCLPESGRLQTNDLGEGQVSVRFVFTERKQVSAAMKLCT